MTVTRRGYSKHAALRTGVEHETLLSNPGDIAGRQDDFEPTDRRGGGRQHQLLCRRHVRGLRPPCRLAGAPARDRGNQGNGLRLTGFGNFERNIAADALTLSEDSRIFADAGTVLVTVKSADTAEMADIIATHAPADAVIVSLQNGVGNVAVLREKLPGRRVLAAMVPFNVIALGDGRFHRATSGDIIIERDDTGC